MERGSVGLLLAFAVCAACTNALTFDADADAYAVDVALVAGVNPLPASSLANATAYPVWAANCTMVAMPAGAPIISGEIDRWNAQGRDVSMLFRLGADSVGGDFGWLAKAKAIKAVSGVSQVRMLPKFTLSPTGEGEGFLVAVLAPLAVRGIDALPFMVEKQPLRLLPSIGAAPSPSSPPSTDRDDENPLIKDILDSMREADYDLRVRELSGDAAFLLDGKEMKTDNRYTFNPMHHYDAQYLSNWCVDLGYDTWMQEFPVGNTITQNVVCSREGTVHEEVVVVGAHYDSISNNAMRLAPGAVDNASGAAGVMIMAEAFARYGFDYTTHFVFFGGEEQGLYGSAHYVAEAQKEGVEIEAALVFDMIAYSNKYFGLKVEGTKDKYIQELMQELKKKVKSWTPDLSVNLSNDSFGSDHVSFQAAGVTAILAIEQDDTDYHSYHKTTDTIANVNAKQGLDIVKAMSALLCDVAEVHTLHDE